MTGQRTIAAMKRIVFDAHAILKWAQQEPGADKVKAVLEACREGSATGLINRINLGEVYYQCIRAVGMEKARDFLENFERLPISLVLPDADLIWRAAEIKAQFAISYAHCFAAATALRHEAAVLTGDPEFRLIAHLCPVSWL